MKCYEHFTYPRFGWTVSACEYPSVLVELGHLPYVREG